MTPEQIAAGAACYQCLNEDQKRAAILYLLDQFASGGSGGGGLFVLKAGDTMTGRLVSPNINYTAQGSTPTAPASGFVEFADSTGRKSWIRGSDGFVRTWDSTLTANRVFSLPDATTTIAGLNVAQTFTLANTFSANGALSAPAVSFTGTPITGGSSTTTKPLVLVETSGATSTGWSISGTMLGVNAPSGFAGPLLDLQLNGSQYFRFTAGGVAAWGSGTYLQIGSSILSQKAAANFQLGAADAAAPVAQTLSVQSVVAGTTDTAGAAFTIKGSAGTGSGAGGVINLSIAPAGGSGTSQNAFVTPWRISSTGHLISPTDNTYDIGASAATRPRLIYTAGGAILNNIAIGSGASSSLIRITASSDGVLKITNDATTDVNRIQLGGTTSSFPAIKRSGTSVAIRLADDSADAGLTAGTATFSGDVALSKTVTAAGTTGAQTINKSSGSVNFAAAATSLVVTDSLVTTSSIIIATVASNDTTMKSVAVVAGSGSFTIHANAAATAETRVNFIVTN